MGVGEGFAGQMSVSRLMDTASARFHEVWRFLAVGFASTIIEFTLFNAMIVLLAFGPVTAKVLATSAAMANAYFGNRHWSFQHRPRTKASQQAPRFVAVNLVGIAIGAIVIALAGRLFGVESVIALNMANAFAILVAMVFRFWAYHHWVFPTEHRIATRGGLAGPPVPAMSQEPERPLELVGAGR